MMHPTRSLLAALCALCVTPWANADSFKCGLEAANKFAASAKPAAAADDNIVRAVAAVKEDDFDDDAAREAAMAAIFDALSKPGGVSESAAYALRDYLYSMAAGIQSGAKGGWDDFELFPQPDKRLKFVEAVKETPCGEISSAWEYKDGKCTWRFTIPEGAKATVCVNGMCKRYKPGKYTLEIKQ